jgi:hypothetical protein
MYSMRKAWLLGTVVTSLVGFSIACNSEQVPEGDGLDAPGVANENYTIAPEDKAAIEKLRVAVKNLDQAKVSFEANTPFPKNAVGSVSNQIRLFGIDWFQKWPGGLSADHSWSNGTDAGKRCMWASLLRFEAIAKDAPEEVVDFVASYRAWGGGFYNWVDDYSRPDSYGDGSKARLWAWRTGLSKWISATTRDGSCILPTRKGLIAYVAKCKAQVADGSEMQGCSVDIYPADDVVPTEDNSSSSTSSGGQSSSSTSSGGQSSSSTSSGGQSSSSTSSGGQSSSSTSSGGQSSSSTSSGASTSGSSGR